MLPLGAGTLATKCLRKAPCKVMLVKQEHGRPFRRLVACVDFSDMSRLAVTQALRIASQDRCEVHFLHVYHPYWSRSGFFSNRLPASADFDAAHRAMLENNLRHFVNANAGLKSVFVVREDPTHGQGIGRYCREVGADLVILGTRGKTNLKYVLLGSTVERLLREIPCSTLVVRPAVEAAADVLNAGDSRISATISGS
jgi:nucleotide-binding universal stress UspA family protein